MILFLLFCHHSLSLSLPKHTHRYLEPLYNDYRRVIYRNIDGSAKRVHIDEFIWDVLHEDMVCDIALPRLPSRLVLEESGTLAPRESVLEEDFIQASSSLANNFRENCVL